MRTTLKIQHQRQTYIIELDSTTKHSGTTKMETFLAFYADDKESLSTSVWAGRLN